jgi:hypothetical protein
MLTVVAMSLLAAAPSLAVPSFSAVGVPADKVTFLEEHLASELSKHGLRVVTQREVTSLLGMERMRQLTNCDPDNTSCVAELSDALGVKAVVMGNVAKLDQLYVVELKVVSSGAGNRLASASARAATELQLLDQLDVAARSLAEQLGAPVVKDESTGGPPRWLGVAGLVAGAGLVVTSVVFAEQAGVAKRGLDPAEPISVAAGEKLRDDGKSAQTAAVALGVAGGALLLTGALVAWSPWKKTAVAVAPSSGGATLVLAGVLP